jgi:gluconolactonase
MKKSLILLSLIASAAFLAAAPAPQSPPQSPTQSAPQSAPNPKSPIADGAKPVLLGSNFGPANSFTEGSTSDKDGDIYFVDQNNDMILKWEFDKTSDDPLKGKMLTFMHPSGYSNGMCFDNDWNLISCADEKNELWEIKAPFPKHADDPKKAFTRDDLKINILIKDYDPAAKKLNPDANGKPMNGPNDVWVIPTGPQKGGMYIGDPLYARNWWATRPGGRGMQQAGKFVYFLSPDRKTLTPVITDFVGRGGANGTPNGIIGTPDGKTLYVSNIDAGQTFSYTINADGTLADKKLFCNAGSDGMTIDSDGNVYTTVGNARTGCQIWDKNGVKIDTIPLGCANVCFGGKDGNILFICAGREVYGLKMKTHRVGPQ